MIYIYIYISYIRYIYIYTYIYIYIRMRSANNPDPKKYKDVHFMICHHMFLKNWCVFEHAKTPSPGRFPEGNGGFPGWHPGSIFCIWGLFTAPLSYNHTFPVLVCTQNSIHVKNTESRKVPGRKRGVSRKASRKVNLMNTAM